jgi:hypothetical protein
MGTRAEFLPRTRKLIAARAGYRCSIPACQVGTIGPGSLPEHIIDTGTAAHIYAASKGGPRGTGPLSNAELRGAQNGIWLCATHGRLIDTNRGTQYPPALLQSYKSLQEARIAREQRGIYTPFGWLQEITITRSPIIRSGQSIRFGKVTLISGNNGTGKTAITDWLTGGSDHVSLLRWISSASSADHLRCSLTLFTPEKHILRIEGGSEGIRYFINDTPSAIPPSSVKFVRLREPPSSTQDNRDDLSQLSEQLRTDKVLICNVLAKLGSSTKGEVKKARLEKRDGDLRLVLDVTGTVRGLTFGRLSRGEKALVAMDIAIALTQSYATFWPAILVIDQGYPLDHTLLQKYVDYLASSDHSFQTIMVLPRWENSIIWTGWEVVELSGKAPDVMIDQSLRPDK